MTEETERFVKWLRGEWERFAAEGPEAGRFDLVWPPSDGLREALEGKRQSDLTVGVEGDDG